MGLDLKLLPFDGDHHDLSFSHTVLTCDRNYDLFDQIQALEETRGRLVPTGFSSYVSRDEKYEESHYGETKETPYGQPLREVEVEDLLPFRRLCADWKNLAIWAYLEHLPPRTKVALFWH